MRQGRADKSGNAGWKTEPKAKGVDVCGVSEWGRALTWEAPDRDRADTEQGYNVRGPTRATPGPGGGRTIHRSGSQGHHK